MLNQTKTIIYVTKNMVRGATVSLKGSPVVTRLLKGVFDQNNLIQVVAEIAKKLESNRIYLLLGDDFSYTVSFTIPVQTQLFVERDLIYQRLLTLIPENLSNGDWDYKVIGVTEKEKKIIAFAPVSTIYQQLKKIFNELKIIIDVVEPENVSITRNTDPIIGIALKDDITGSDEETLNLVNIKLSFLEKIKRLLTSN